MIGLVDGGVDIEQEIKNRLAVFMWGEGERLKFCMGELEGAELADLIDDPDLNGIVLSAVNLKWIDNMFVYPKALNSVIAQNTRVKAKLALKKLDSADMEEKREELLEYLAWIIYSNNMRGCKIRV